jgi:hypothetical protein
LDEGGKVSGRDPDDVGDSDVRELAVVGELVDEHGRDAESPGYLTDGEQVVEAAGDAAQVRPRDVR